MFKFSYFMEDVLKKIEILLIELNNLPPNYNADRGEQIIDIYYRFELIVKLLYQNNFNLWDSFLTGVTHIKYNHISTLENYRTSSKRKHDSYHFAYQQLRVDLKEVIDKLST